jgi:hypothetical protein
MDGEVKNCQQMPGISSSPSDGYLANRAPFLMAALGLERLSHEEFRVHITIPIAPLLILHN